MLLEIFEDADVSEAESAAAFEHEGYAGTVFGVGGIVILKGGRVGCGSCGGGR
jgi:hypothetical protein